MTKNYVEKRLAILELIAYNGRYLGKLIILELIYLILRCKLIYY